MNKRLFYHKYHTLNSIARIYKMKPEWFNYYISEYCNINQIDFYYHHYLMDREFFIIESALGSPELIDDIIDPLIYNNNTKLAKLYGIDRKTMVKRLYENENILKSVKQIYPYRTKYIPGEVGLIIREFGVPEDIENL